METFQVNMTELEEGGMFDEETMPEWMRSMRGVGRCLFNQLMICLYKWFTLNQLFPGAVFLRHILQQSIRWPLRESSYPHTFRAPLWVLRHQGCLRGYNLDLRCRLLVLAPLA